MKNQRLGARALKKTILAALLLGSASSAHAAVNLTVTWDSVADVTTLTVTNGSWDVYVSDGGNGIGTHGFSSTIAYHMSGNQTVMNTGLSRVSGSAMPSTGAYVPASSSGASWGFTSTRVFAPVGYSATESFSSSSTVSGNTFGLGALSAGGSYAGGGNTFTWTPSIVPEPASASLLVGLCAFARVARRRR